MSGLVLGYGQQVRYRSLKRNLCLLRLGMRGGLVPFSTIDVTRLVKAMKNPPSKQSLGLVALMAVCFFYAQTGRALEELVIVGDQQVGRGDIFLDVGEAAYFHFEPVVGAVVIDRGDFADQHVGAFTPESMPDAGHQSDRFRPDRA